MPRPNRPQPTWPEQTTGERGGALVEMAIVFMLLMTLVNGTVEYGSSWRDTMVLEQASRGGARVAANLNDDPQADREALRAVVSHLDARDLDQIEYVVIYQPLNNGAMPPGCEIASSALCNHYDPTALASLDDDASWGCGVYDSGWCPSDREPELTSPVDLGVHIQARRSWLTDFFPGDGIDLSATTIMRLDPLNR